MPARYWRRALLLAVWFGLWTGIGSAALIGIKKFVLDRITLSTPQIVWVAPAILMVLSVPVGFLLAAAARIAPARHRLRVLVFVQTLAACIAGLLIWGKELADIPLVLLSLGIAVQLSWYAVQRPHRFQRLVRFTFPLGAAVVLLGAAVVNVGGPLLERIRIARLPAPPPGAPNVLIIILDTVRSLNLSLYGYPRPTTPNLERIARESVVFDYAIAPSSWTLPSHASMFTGRPAHELSTDWSSRLDTTHPTLAEYFRDLGYRTGGIVGNWFYCNSEWGIDRGFIHYTDYVNTLGHALFATGPGEALMHALERKWEQNFWFHRLGSRRIAPDISEELIGWLERDRSRPYFAFVNFYDAHDPYVAPDAYLERFVDRPDSPEQPVWTLENGQLVKADSAYNRQMLRYRDSYDAALAYLDAEIGRLYDTLQARGLLDNTLVIIASDHGEEFGEGGYAWHGLSLRTPSLRVPLLIRFPGRVPAGVRVEQTVTLTDLAATVVELTGLESGSPFPGESLAGTWTDEIASPRPVTAWLRLQNVRPVTGTRELRAVFTDEYRYVLTDTGRQRLFRYRSDPFEQDDRMFADSLEALRHRILLERLTGRDWADSRSAMAAGGTGPR